jgi:uncharacterized Zn finger protein
MSKIPKITESAVRAYLGEGEVKKGKPYYEGGALFNTRRQGMTLKADCHGSLPHPYRVEATFSAKGIAGSDCSCPVGGGGGCKHVAALLLAWCREPKEFVEVEELDQSLDRRSKGELIALIKQMVRRQPDLELLLEAPVPGAGKRAAPVKAETYRRQAAAVFRGSSGEWGESWGIAGELEAIVKTGDEFLEQEDCSAAAAVYEGVASAVIEGYETVHDEEGEVSSVVTSCVEGLGKCLKATKDDPVKREAILRALHDIYRFDTDYGGIGISDEVPDLVLKHASPEERRTFAGWLRDAIPKGGDWDSKWRREAYGGFLLDLEEGSLDDEAFLKHCRELGLQSDLVDRLLQLGRLDEAVAEAKRADDYELLQLADIFLRHRHGDDAEKLIEERARKSNDTRLLEWLIKRASAQGDKARLLELTEKLFRTRPSLEGYKQLRRLSGKAEWEQLRPKLLDLLKKPTDRYLLVQIYLDEGEIEQALESVRTAKGYEYGYGMGLEVAKAAEKTHPADALDIYSKQAENLIGQRSRGSYQEACKFLRKVRDLYRRLDEEEMWSRYVAGLRDKHRSLRALQEELTKAKL